MHACTNMHDLKPKHEDILNVFSSNFFRVDFFSQPRTSCEMNHRLQQADLHFCDQQKHATCMLEVPGYCMRASEKQ